MDYKSIFNKGMEISVISDVETFLYYKIGVEIMPWCPQCKAEYQEGFTECKDCKVPLVDQLEDAKIEFVPFIQSEDKKILDKLAKFFEYSELDCEVTYDEEYEVYTLSIPPEYETDAKKLYQAFYTVEQERQMQEAFENAANKLDSDVNTETFDDSEENYELESDDENSQIDEEDSNNPIVDDANEEAVYDKTLDTSVYVMKADEYKDLSGTVFLFLLFGIAGVAFVLLNITGFLSLLNGWLPNIVMGLVFLAFIYIGISTNKKAKKVRSEIDTENKLTGEINDWLKENITESFLASIHNDDISEEANYIRYNDVIKEKLIKEFGPQNLAYLDRLIDEFYTNTFDEDAE